MKNRARLGIGTLLAALGLIGALVASGVSCDRSRCGNGVVERGEECDDGNEIGWDGCDACRITACGNGVVDEGEECDDGSPTGWDGCTGCRIAELLIGSGINPSVAAGPDGGFVVVWDEASETQAGWSIYARLYGADGAFWRDPIKVGDSRGGFPAVATRSDGGFVVVWIVNPLNGGSLYQVMGSRFDAVGGPAGGLFQVTDGASYSAAGVVVGLGDRFLCSWSGWDPSRSVPQLRGQWYDADGAPDATPLVLAQASDPIPIVSSRVTVQEPAGLLALWVEYRVGQQSTSYRLRARRMTLDGTPLGAILEPGPQDESLGGSSVLLRPDVAAFAGGAFTFLEADAHQARTWTVGADDTLPAAPQIVDDAGQGPAAAAAAGDRGVIVWNCGDVLHPAGPWNLMGRRIDPAGQPVGEDFAVSLALAGDEGSGAEPRSPQVAMAPDGTFVVVWQGQGGIFVKRFSAAGVPLGW